MNLAEPKAKATSFLPDRLKGTKSYINLGLRSMERTIPLMRELAFARSIEEISNHLILVQHPPVFSVGRGIQRTIRLKNKSDGPETLTQLQARLPYPVLEIERGGGLTFHDPGQFIGYPIIRLDPKKGAGLHDYLRNLEFFLIEVLQGLVPDQEFTTHPEATGIWVRGKKVVSIGIAVRRWVTFHGFAINLNTDLKSFQLIRPCGLHAQNITNLCDVAGRMITHQEVMDVALNRFPHFFLKGSHIYGF